MLSGTKNTNEDLLNSSDNTLISCDYQFYGCDFKFLEKEKELHLDDFVFEHNTMIVNFIKDFQNSFKDDLDKIANFSQKIGEDIIDLENTNNDIFEKRENLFIDDNILLNQKHTREEELIQDLELDEDTNDNLNEVMMMDNDDSNENSLENTNLLIKSTSIKNKFSKIKNNIRTKFEKDSLIHRSKNFKIPLKSVEILRTRSINQRNIVNESHDQNLKNMMEIDDITEENKFEFKIEDNFYLTNGLLKNDSENKIKLAKLNKDHPYQIIMYNQKLNLNLNTSINNSNTFKWTIEINFSENDDNKNNWISFGVCVKESIEKNLKYFETTPNGMFTLSSEGILCHNNSSFKNNTKMNNFIFTNNEKIMIEYNNSTKELLIRKNEDNFKISKVFTVDKNLSLVPIIILKNLGDEINFKIEEKI